MDSERTVPVRGSKEGGAGNNEGGGPAGRMSLFTVTLPVSILHSRSQIGMDSNIGLVTPAMKSGLLAKCQS